jgi:hypothetical protein
MVAWANLSQARRQALRTGLRRVLARVVGARRMRLESEPPEVD